LYTALSVFDLDHTLLSANCSFKFGSFLYRNKLISSRTLCACLIYYARHKWFNLSLNQVHRQIFNCLFKDKLKKTIEVEALRFLEENLRNLYYEPVLNRLQKAQDAGHYIVILSSSPDFLVGPIAKKLNVNEYKPTIYQADKNGYFNQIDHVLDGDDKANHVLSLQKKFNIPKESVTVYSDSYLDLPVLKIAGKAIGVVPDGYLRRVCLLEKWEII
jgi:HAD superfamily hydrolase (TIGR01490 family)